MTDNTMAERKQCTKLKDKQQSTIHYTMYIFSKKDKHVDNKLKCICIYVNLAWAGTTNPYGAHEFIPLFVVLLWSLPNKGI
jgi:hypothetical protein